MRQVFYLKPDSQITDRSHRKWNWQPFASPCMVCTESGSLQWVHYIIIYDTHTQQIIFWPLNNPCLFLKKTFFPESPRNQSSSYINSSQASINSYQVAIILRHALSATINKPVLVATTLSAYARTVSHRRKSWSLILVLTLSFSCFDCPECKPRRDDTNALSI